MRAKLSEQFIKGHGVEIGALHCPLPLFNGATATYVDLEPIGGLRYKNPDLTITVAPTIFANAEILSSISAESADFVIANHVFEHCENPILTVKNWLRVLKPGGIIFAAIPDKEQCFDRKRKVTSLTHLLRDYIVGTDQSLEEHYRDWFANSELEGLKGEELEARVAQSMKDRNNIHFHVWDEDALRRTFSYLDDIFGFSSYEIHRNGAELIVICQK